MVNVNFINSNGEGYLVIPFEFSGEIQEFIDDVLDRQKSIKEFDKTEISFYCENHFSYDEKKILRKHFDILDF